MTRADDQARIAALEADVERLRTERDDLANALEAMIARSDRRRGRFEAELDRRRTAIERRDGSIRQRDAALAKAQAKLARPLPRFALTIDGLARRVVRRLRRVTAVDVSRTATRHGEGAPDVAVPPGRALREVGLAIDRSGLRLGLVGDPADGKAIEAALRRPTGRPAVEVSWVQREVAAHDPPVDLLIAVSPSVGIEDLDERRIRAAWVTSAEAWEDPRFDDFDLALCPDDRVAELVARVSAHVPTVMRLGAPDVAAATVVGAVRTWKDARWIAIHIAPKDWVVAPKWGDSLFARGLQRALRKAGWVASVQVASQADAPRATEADVALHIAGVSRPPMHDGQPTMLWVISHPDLVSARACESYDMVFVASDPFSQELERRITTPVRVLHQATDPDRFFPEPGGPPHDVLFVGNSRGVKRSALQTLAASPFSLAVYGSNWTPELLDPSVVQGEWIPNAELHRYYASASIVLSDHWPDMRDDGFISNRVYDALASGAFVVSDRVTGIEERFEGAVATYADDAELLAVVGEALAHPDERGRRAERGRAVVLDRDTFAHRASAIIDGARAIGVAAG